MLTGFAEERVLIVKQELCRLAGDEAGSVWTKQKTWFE
jgi:hypothetical protein